jgi:hypothetical protein
MILTRYRFIGEDTLESSGPGTESPKPPKKARAKGRGRTIAIIAIVLVVVIVLLAVILNGNGGSSTKPEFQIIDHSAYAEDNTNGTFNATVIFIVNNTGNVPGNVTVIFKVKNGGYVWAGAQIFYMEPGQSFSSYKKHIPVNGDADSPWVYQCFISGAMQPPWYPHD